MIAADTNIWIYYLEKREGADIECFGEYFDKGEIALPPAVISEFLSSPFVGADVHQKFLNAVFLEPDRTYWNRAGLMRAAMIQKGFKPKLPDTLIAQSCIDHDIPLLTRDEGFEMFAEHGGLQLVETGA